MVFLAIKSQIVEEQSSETRIKELPRMPKDILVSPKMNHSSLSYKSTKFHFIQELTCCVVVRMKRWYPDLGQPHPSPVGNLRRKKLK